MESDPDRALVDAAARGDADAFGALVVRYQARIVNLAHALTSDAADADDLAQETFIRAYRAIGKFRGESSFRTWLYRVAVNVINSYLKSRGRRWKWWGRSLDAGRAHDSEADQAVEVAAPDPPIDEDMARRQVIDRALAALPSDIRIAVTLRDIHGFDYAEIAAMLGVPIGTVESRIFRGRQRLRPLLAGLIDVRG